CRFLVFQVDLFRVGVHFFEVVCELRLVCRLLPRVLALSLSGMLGVFELGLVCLGSHFTVFSSSFSLKELFFGF
ncbi:hypothetical protein A2U01_0088125, partial [Trifolium medium]|nr:hypothetical protein [Trifolium medium]